MRRPQPWLRPFFQIFFMKLPLGLAAFLFFANSLLAQNSNTITIKAGEDVSVLYRHIYKYPQFVYGKVYFKDGTIAGSKMNFNLLLEAMQFLDEKGDTLALANEETIKYVAIGIDTFYFDEGYLQRVSAFGDIELAAKQKIKFLDEKNIGAYGISTSTHTIDNYNTLRAHHTYSLKLNKDLVYAKEMKYYFDRGDRVFIIANKKNILKSFSTKKGMIEDYLKQHEIDFNKEDDLKIFFSYLAAH